MPNPGLQVVELRKFLSQGKSGGSSPGSGALRLLQQPTGNVPEQTRQRRVLNSHQLLLCLISLVKPTLPKQSEEIKCSTYFGLQELRTPTSLGFSQKFPTDALHSFIFHMKQCRNNHKTCSLSSTHPAEPSLLPRKCQKLLAFHPHQLQVLSTPQDVAARVPGRRDPPVTVPTPPAVCQGSSVALPRDAR